MAWLKGLLVVGVFLLMSSGASGQENASKGSSQCRGCLVNGRCLQVGLRLEGHYCWVDGQLQPQRQLGERCENGFECEINQCIEGTCKSAKAAQEPKGFFEELKDWIFHIFRFVIVKRI